MRRCSEHKGGHQWENRNKRRAFSARSCSVTSVGNNVPQTVPSVIVGDGKDSHTSLMARCTEVRHLWLLSAVMVPIITLDLERGVPLQPPGILKSIRRGYTHVCSVSGPDNHFLGSRERIGRGQFLYSCSTCSMYCRMCCAYAFPVNFGSNE